MDTSYLTSQVATIIAQLHGLFDEIGVPSHERDTREAKLFAALSESLQSHLRQVAAEKDGMVGEAQRIILTIKQMEASLEGGGTKSDESDHHDDRDLSVSYPLTRCLQNLKQKHSTIAKMHKERFEQVKKLVQALESYSSHLEPSFVHIALPPTSSDGSIPTTFDLSPSYVTALDDEFTRVYEEYTRRVSIVQTTSEEIIKLWAELGTPQAQTDSSIVKDYRDSPEQLGLHRDDLKRLAEKKERLVEEKRGRERRLKELRLEIETLWDRLGVAEPDCKAFLNNNRGCGLRVINEFEDELARLKELKRQNLHLFVEDARYKLQELWDALYFSEEEMLEFTPAFSDVYSDALLSSHEAEISRLEALKGQRAPILQFIDKHRSLVKDRDDLAASSQDASRLMLRGQKGERRDPTRLLREEKMRKRIAKELPKVEVELRKALEDWEAQWGRPFCVHGQRYLDELEMAATRNLPPRSKTPSIPPSSSLHRSTRSVPSIQRPVSVMGGPAPARSNAKTPTGTLRRNPFASSTSTTGGRTGSPSKIPGRVPLSNMPQGPNNSPERGVAAQLRAHGTLARKMGPPSMAPPPKMRDLFEPPPAPTTVISGVQQHNNNNAVGGPRSASASSSHGSVRHVSPEDVYDDAAAAAVTQQAPYMHSSMMMMMMPSQRSTHQQQFQSSTYQGTYPSAAASRQISTTSSGLNTTVSGSENWETYDDASEPEPDASEAYYAKLRAARGKQRFTPEVAAMGYGGAVTTAAAAAAAGRMGQVKKIKGIRGDPPTTATTTTLVEGEGGRMIAVSGSDAGWTDEDAF